MVQLCPRLVTYRIVLIRVPSGNQCTLAAAGTIGRLIRESAKDFFVRQRAIEIFRFAGVDRFGEIRSLSSQYGEPYPLGGSLRRDAGNAGLREVRAAAAISRRRLLRRSLSRRIRARGDAPITRLVPCPPTSLALQKRSRCYIRPSSVNAACDVSQTLRADGNERLACLTQLGVEHEVEA
jgi:hypothetical protein